MAHSQLLHIINTTVSEDGVTAETFLPCLAHEMFDRTGNMSLQSVSRLFEFGRVAPFSNRKYIGGIRYEANYLIFVVRCKYKFSRSFFTMAKEQRMSLQLNMKTSLLGAKKATLLMRTEAQHGRTKETLSTLDLSYVLIDRKIRKSTPLPANFKARYGKYFHDYKRQNFETQTKPDTAFKHRFRVLPSDTDINGHTNQGTYVRMCMDAAAIAISQQCLPGFTTDIGYYHAESMDILYSGETLLGDNLDVHVWEGDEKLTLHFHIMKGDKIVNHCSVKFFPLVSAQL